MNIDLPAAALAQLDQEVATLDTCVELLVSAASALVAEVGYPKAVVTMTLSLLSASNSDKSAAIAAAAIVRLSEERRNV